MKVLTNFILYVLGIIIFASLVLFIFSMFNYRFPREMTPICLFTCVFFTCNFIVIIDKYDF